MSSETMDHSEVPNTGLNWQRLVMGSVIVLGLIIFLFKGCKGSNDSEIEPPDSAKAETFANSYAKLQTSLMKVKLPHTTLEVSVQ